MNTDKDKDKAKMEAFVTEYHGVSCDTLYRQWKDDESFKLHGAEAFPYTLAEEYLDKVRGGMPLTQFCLTAHDNEFLHVVDGRRRLATIFKEIEKPIGGVVGLARLKNAMLPVCRIVLICPHDKLTEAQKDTLFAMTIKARKEMNDVPPPVEEGGLEGGLAYAYIAWDAAVAARKAMIANDFKNSWGSRCSERFLAVGNVLEAAVTSLRGKLPRDVAQRIFYKYNRP